VRKVWPENLPLTAKFGVIEYDGHDEETLAESVRLVAEMRELRIRMNLTGGSHFKMAGEQLAELRE
jgi:hypothetical protein